MNQETELIEANSILSQAPSEERLNEFVHKIIGDMGAATSAALVLIGDKLGLYRTLARLGPMSSGQLAEATGTSERYVREWLAAQAAAGYIAYSPTVGTFELTPEQAAVLADEDGPAYMTGGFYAAASLLVDEPKVSAAFQTGEGIGWGDHSECLFCGTEKFFRPSYANHLVNEWVPSLEGVLGKLNRGARVADVGCGHGASTLVMAKAFPQSVFFGFDFHAPSIRHAQEGAAAEGLTNVHFEAVAASDIPHHNFDLVAFFDCLHDMGDPVGALRRARQILNRDGTLMLVEPFAHDRLEDNLNPISRLFYNFSTMVCTPASLSQEVGLGLGAQAGEQRLREVVLSAGFNHFRRATQTPFNLILEGRP